MSRWANYYFANQNIERAMLDDGYIYLAETPSSMRPSKKTSAVAGEHVQAVVRNGVRQWAFKQLINRDKFIDKYPEAKRVFSVKEAAKMYANPNL